MSRIVFAISLTVRSPFLFSGLGGSVVGVDQTFLRDERGFPIIPSDQIRGVLREALEDMAAAGAIPETVVAAVFGTASAGETDALASNLPARGNLNITDLIAERWLPDPENAPGQLHDYTARHIVELTRIEIDDDLGSTKAGALQVLELAIPQGAAAVFKGRIVLYDDGDTEPWRRRLNQALSLIIAIGAVKSGGFGEVLEAVATFESSRPLALPPAGRRYGNGLRLRVRFDRPILVNAVKVSDNVFEGADVLPGAVFKGALARRLELAGAKGWETALSDMTFSHAFPEVLKDGKPAGVMAGQPIPLSLGCSQGPKPGSPDIFGDALRLPYDRGAMIGGRIVQYQPDWKVGQFAKAGKALGMPDYTPSPLLARTHTAIDRRMGSALDQQLFVTLARSVWNEGSARTWLMDVHLPDDSDMSHQILACLLEGLDDIGKTGARADFEGLGTPPVRSPRAVFWRPNHYAVTLVTPALMLDPAKVLDASGWTRTAEDAYAAYWREILPSARLINFFADQHYTGGYLAKRHRLYPGGYFPFILTKPGSVFLIETGDTDGLAAFCKNGLPVAGFEGAFLSWRNCPYMPQNGYGQITADYLADSTQVDLAEIHPDTGEAA